MVLKKAKQFLCSLLSIKVTVWGILTYLFISGIIESRDYMILTLGLIAARSMDTYSYNFGSRAGGE